MLCQTLDDVEVIPPTEPKAVLEHRAPKASPPILHTRGVESKVGRGSPLRAGVGYADSASPGLESWRPRPYGRGYGARLSRLQKTCGQDGRTPNPPKGGESKVGRAVRCAPELVMQTRPPGLESCHPRPYGRGYEPVICWCGKNTLLILHPAGRGLPALPAIGF